MKKLIYLFTFASFILLSSFRTDTPQTDPKAAKAAKAEEPEKELKWYSWNEGYAKANKEGKIVLVDVYTAWCGWCKRMDKDTYSKGEIVDAINKKFVPIKLNPEEAGEYNVDEMKVTGSQLFNMLTNNQNTGYPTIIFIYPTVRQVVIQPGYQDATKFKETLTSIVENGKNLKDPKGAKN